MPYIGQQALGGRRRGIPVCAKTTQLSFRAGSADIAEENTPPADFKRAEALAAVRSCETRRLITCPECGSDEKPVFVGPGSANPQGSNHPTAAVRSMGLLYFIQTDKYEQ